MGYSYEEGSDYTEFEHLKKFTKKEFDGYVIDATVEFLLNIRKRKYGGPFLADEGEIEEKYATKYTSTYYTNFDDIQEEVADVMVEKYGFKIVEYEQEVDVGGFCPIVDPGERNDEILNKVREKYWKLKKDKKNGV